MAKCLRLLLFGVAGAAMFLAAGFALRYSFPSLAWDIGAEGEEQNWFYAKRDLPAAVTALDAFGDYVATGLVDGRIGLTDIASGSCSFIIGHGAPVKCVRFSRDGKTLFSGSSDGKILEIDVPNMQVRVLCEARGFVNVLDIHPGGSLIVGIADGDKGWIAEWDFGRSDALSRIAATEWGVRRIAIPTGTDEIIARVPPGFVSVYGRSDHHLRKKLQYGQLGPDVLVISPDAKWLVVGESEVVPRPGQCLWPLYCFDYPEMKQTRKITVPDPWNIVSATFSLDSRSLLVWSLKDGNARFSRQVSRLDVVSIDNLSVLYTKEFSTLISSCAFLKKDKRLALGGGRAGEGGILAIVNLSLICIDKK